MELPHLQLIDQGFVPGSRLDARRGTLEELARAGLLGGVQPGQTVLVTAGSRGVDCMAEVLGAVVAAVKQKGAKPVILPAMGSHGGGTAAGQIAVLEHLGQTPETLGAPIHDRVEPVEIGEVEGCPVYADRAAVEADHILIVNRVKEHTEFIGEIESRISYVKAIQAIARVLFQKLPIRGGVAILEDKTNTVRRLEAVPAADVFEREPQLLAEARQHHASLPFDQLDVLLVDEIGKDISGAGFDTKVIGRIMNIYEKECERPRITRIVLRDLSGRTGGNAIGLGLADYVHRRVVDKMDAAMTALNCITAVAPEKARIPIVQDSDRQALEAAFRSIGLWNAQSVRLAWIINTSDLRQLAVSPALAAEARAKGLAVAAESFALPFHSDDLMSLRQVFKMTGAG